MAADSKGGWTPHGWRNLPESVQQAGSLQRTFEEAHSPDLKELREYYKLSEAERREQAGSGSGMVKLSKPFPELKPKSAEAKQALREDFNQRWEAEKSRAQRAPNTLTLAREFNEKSTQESKAFEHSVAPFPKRELSR
jgi:hypothetical protein